MIDTSFSNLYAKGIGVASDTVLTVTVSAGSSRSMVTTSDNLGQMTLACYDQGHKRLTGAVPLLLCLCLDACHCQGRLVMIFR